MKGNNNFFRVPPGLVKRYYAENSALPRYRTEFMRDRDRLMYATAFRRLSGKTQIYTVGGDDHRKNRLTHTLEVAQIARTIAAALGFDTDLAEAIALGHDFGHTPFGHAGERMLHEIMIPESCYVKDSPFYNTSAYKIEQKLKQENQQYAKLVDWAYGFKHNIQSVRVAAVLENSYCDDTRKNIGLNLTNFALFGMMIHSNLYYKDHDFHPNYQKVFKRQMSIDDDKDHLAWSFEAYIVRWSDDIAQWHHDLEDAMREGALPVNRICETIRESLGRRLNDTDKAKLSEIEKAPLVDRKRIAVLSHIVVNTLVNDLVETSKANLKALQTEAEHRQIIEEETDGIFTDFDQYTFSMKKEEVITASKEIYSDNFKDTIKEAIHHSRGVERMNEKGKYIIRKLFEAYCSHPQQLPDGPILHFLTEFDPIQYPNIDEAKEKGIGKARTDFDVIIKKTSMYASCLLMRRICDHIACMTDHYAITEYNNLYG